MRRLEGAVDGELALDLVDRADALAGLQRRRMGALVGDQLLDRHRGLGEGARRSARGRRPSSRRCGCSACAGHARRSVLSPMSSRSTGASSSIALKGSISGGSGSYSTSTASMPSSAAISGRRRRRRRPPGSGTAPCRRPAPSARRRPSVGIQASFTVFSFSAVRTASTPGTFSAALSSIFLMRACGMGRADEVAEQHAGQLDVVDVVAPALGEADVLDALALAAHAFECGGALFPRGSEVVHSAASWNSTPLILAAAY